MTHHGRWAGAIIPILVIAVGLWVTSQLSRPAARAAREGAMFLDAIERDDVEAIRRALDAGMSPDARDPRTGITPLIWASCQGRPEIMRLLLSRGARLDTTADGYGTPLASAAYCGEADAVRMLLEHGADPDVGTSGGMTPLMKAAAAGEVQSLDLLIRAGADVNARDNTGATALVLAVEARCDQAVRRLVSAGARRRDAPRSQDVSVSPPRPTDRSHPSPPAATATRRARR